MVILFLTDEFASITAENKRLRRFSKISLEPDEIKTINLVTDQHRLAFAVF